MKTRENPENSRDILIWQNLYNFGFPRPDLRLPYLVQARLSPFAARRSANGCDRQTGRIRIDGRGNACFLHQDDNGISGYEVKNKGFTGFSGGGKKALFMCRVGEQAGDSPMIAIAESVIGIMSYCQLHPADGLYVSIGGAMSPEQQEQLTPMLTRHPHAVVIIPTDKNAAKYPHFIP